MEAKRRLANWVQTAANIRQCFSFVCVLVCLSFAGCRKSPTPEQQFAAITDQIQSGDFVAAANAAKQAWQRQPDTLWGWRYKCQYAFVLIIQHELDKADDVLRGELPKNFSSLRPRYEYVKAYLSYRRDPSSIALLHNAIDLAHAQNDVTTEVDGLLLLLSAGESKQPDGRALAERALDLSRKHGLDFQEANSIAKLGTIELYNEQYADAIPLLTRAVAKSSKYHYLDIQFRANLAECYFRLGDLDRALRQFRDLQPRLKASDPPTLRATVNNQMGMLYSVRQDYLRAVEYFREAFKSAQVLEPTNNSYISSANGLAEGLLELKTAQSLNEAEKFNNLAGQGLARAAKLVPPPTVDLIAKNELNRANIAAARGLFREAEQLYMKVLAMVANTPPDAIKWSAYARLAEAQEQNGKVAEALQNFENALSTIESNRSSQEGVEYQITFLASLIRFYQQYVSFLVRQQVPRVALAVADSSRASVLTQGMVSSRQEPEFFERIQKLANDNQCALLFYSMAPKASYLWALYPGGYDFVELPGENKIQEDVKAYSAMIQSQRRDTLAEPNPVGVQLYDTLIRPIASHLKPGMRVVVVPDGPLHGLNFETLIVNSGQPHYWLQDVSLTIAPSLRILLDESKPKSISRNALLIGNAIYTDPAYPTLHESKKEIDDVCSRFSHGNTVLTQAEAVPEAYQNAHPERFSLIHFSAHVDADAQSPLDSAIILSSGEDGNDRLYARDVMKIHLNADLVTVSGCSSVGKRALSGEGLVGFAWAAFDAGARNAVTSLWEVDERSTTQLMDLFYAGVTAGKPYATALREAKLQMLLNTQFKKPFYWAPFQLYSRDIRVQVSVAESRLRAPGRQR